MFEVEFYYLSSWLNPLDLIIPLLFCSELLWVSKTLGWTGGCYILTLIICYLFFGGRGGIKGFSSCFMWFDWYRCKSLLLYLGIRAGTLLRSPPKPCLYSTFWPPNEGFSAFFLSFSILNFSNYCYFFNCYCIFKSIFYKRLFC